MTEAEWLACSNPTRMLRHLETAASDRKSRLFTCACVRRVRHLNHDARLQRILLGVEGFADGLTTARGLGPLHRLAREIEEDRQASTRFPVRSCKSTCGRAVGHSAPGRIHSATP